MASTAANDSWKPASYRLSGFAPRITKHAKSTMLIISGARQSKYAARKAVTITAALTMDGAGPATSVNPQTSAISSTFITARGDVSRRMTKPNMPIITPQL